MNRPLADIMRPASLEEMVGQEHLLKEGSVFRNALNNKKVPNMIFYGPPGTGKTTIANIIAKQSNLTLYKLNGTNASTDDIKKVIGEIDSLLNGNGILLYLDEIQYLNKKQQQSLLEFVESGDITLIASTTENPYFYIYPALISRCVVFEFKAISSKEIEKGILRACKSLDIGIEEEALHKLAIASNGDMRKCLNNLEFLTSSLEDNKITLAKVEELIDKANIVYDRGEDKHFDNLSALMKSLRGSDPDAALFYMAKLLEGGDLIAVCRRLLCSASEDIGLAYPQIIPIVKAAVDSALQLGMPEARLPLANAAILLATAPKSNAACLAIDAALADVHNGLGINVPRQLQNTHFDGKDAKVRGQHYKYPHDFANHWVDQQYLPDDIKDHKYYVYQDNKYEQSLKEYWSKVKKK
ncbi:MAG: replication-associated recombination protein A [Erysipelotrichaceae bacterium]|nr:replication-associated recombination protein A [Erysipelotrichaceae bacterium]